MAIPEINRDISEQAKYIFENTKKIWKNQIVDPFWSDFDENGWKFDSGTGFYKNGESSSYRVTSVNELGLAFIKYEKKYGTRQAYVETNPTNNVSRNAGSELVELDNLEIFKELHFLNQAIIVFLDRLENPSLLGYDDSY